MNNFAFESINIELTKKCNLVCTHCYASCALHKDQDVVVDLNIYDDFFNRFSAAGGRHVLLTGGEIFLISNLKDVVESAYIAGLNIMLFSNGTIIRGEDYEWIKKHVDLVNISLDGPEEHHDSLRGQKGSYARTLSTLKSFEEMQIRFLLQSTVTPENLAQMEWIYPVCRTYQPLMVRLGHINPVGRGKKVQSKWIGKNLYPELKQIAHKICEEANHFHTRIMTNLVTQEEFKIFYPTIKAAVTPWMTPAGDIHIKYCDGKNSTWKVSNIQKYPEAEQNGKPICELLENKILEIAKGLDYLDLMEVIDQAAEEIEAELHTKQNKEDK